MAEDLTWLGSDPWLSDAEWLELERCSLEWLKTEEPVPPPAQLARLEPLVQRLLSFTLATGRELGKYEPPPEGGYKLSRRAIERLYETESKWQDRLIRDCDRMLRPRSGADARLLLALRACDLNAPIGPQFRRQVQSHLHGALIRAGQDGAKAMVRRERLVLAFNDAQTSPREERRRQGEGTGNASTPRDGSVKELAVIQRVELTMAQLLSDEVRRPTVLATIQELDRRARERSDMAPPALLFLDDYRQRKLSGYTRQLAMALRLFIGRHAGTGEAVGLRECCSALDARARTLAHAEAIPLASAFKRLHQPVLWDVLAELGIEVQAANTMTVRLKRTRDRLLERVSELVRESRRGDMGTPPVTTGTTRPKTGGDHP
jgi:hypothetical protein